MIVVSTKLFLRITTIVNYKRRHRIIPNVISGIGKRLVTTVMEVNDPCHSFNFN